ncbi:MAG: hypothetical protein D6732_12495 [Methanobacteriota archaeon]|nr:MAG: hypothetical protein D6732_12495 [Euryarchaeota archaeon]
MELNEFLDLPFEEAIQNFITRNPVLETDPEELRQRYADEHVFGAVYATTQNMLEEIQNRIAKGFAEGKSTSEIEEEISEAGENFASWYSEVVFRTNMNTAYTEGQIEQAKKFDDFIVGLEFTTSGDANVRPEHRILEGMRAPVDDPIWRIFKTPLDYNCRCSLVQITRPEAERWNNAFDLSGKLRRFHPKIGFDFTDSTILGLVMGESRNHELPSFVMARV